MDCIWLILLLACCKGGCHNGSGCRERGACCSHGRGGRYCDDGAVPMPIFAPQPYGACERGNDHACKPVCCDAGNDCGRDECCGHEHEGCGRDECCGHEHEGCGRNECCGHEHVSCGRNECCEHEQACNCGCDHKCGCE